MKNNNFENVKSYKRLVQQPSDTIARNIDAYIQGSPVILVNKLPVDIVVIHENARESKIIGTLLAHQTLSIADNINNLIRDGDILHFKYMNLRSTKMEFVCPSHSVTKRHSNINVGTPMSYPGIYKRDISPGGDLSSINIHNLLPWPIIISKKQKPLMIIEANSDLGNPNNHGNLTISPSIYYDNYNMGINIGTKFDVSIDNRSGLLSFDKSKSTIDLYSFEITDVNDNEIFIGGVSPIIGASVNTGTNNYIHQRQHIGRAIYRFGDDIDLEDIPPEGVSIKSKAKNARGTDIKRTGLGGSGSSDKSVYARSTNPMSRHQQLSGRNTVNGLYL